MGNFSSKSGQVSLPELVFAAVAVGGLALLVAKLQTNTSQVLRSTTDSYASLDSSNQISIAIKDVRSWFTNDLLPADQLSGSSVLTNCFQASGAICPANEATTVTDQVVTNYATSGGSVASRPVVSVALFVRTQKKIGASDVAGNFTQISGTTKNPVYLTQIGAPCVGATNSDCVRVAYAYMISQSLGATGPGSVIFIRKLAQNPQNTSLGANQIPTVYDIINLGLLWAGSTTGVIPVGAIVPYGGTLAGIPIGYLPCNGAAVSQATYPQLFQVIGTNWGGGGATFNLPNLVSYPYLRGWNTGGPAPVPPYDSGRAGVYQAEQLQPHSYNPVNVALAASSGGSFKFQVSGGYTTSILANQFIGASSTNMTAGTVVQMGCGKIGTYARGPHGLGNNSPTTSGTATISGTAPALGLASAWNSLSASVAAAGGPETRPASVTVNYIIRADYPTQ